MHDPWSPAGSEAKATGWAKNVQDILMSLSSGPGGSREAKQITDDARDMARARLQEDMLKREDVGNLYEGDHEMSNKDKAIKLYAQPMMRFVGGLSDKWERMSK